MEKYLPYAVLLFRITLAVTLLAAVADKLGYWGEPGTPNIIWGNWDSYENYLQSVIPLLPKGITENLAVAVTTLEVVLALMLLFGFKVRWAAVGSGIYTLLLAIAALVFVGVKAPFNLNLFVTFGASVLLACCPIYKFTRHGIKKRSTYHPY
ncbi:DoxX family protein [Pontibacter sp. KCTC 32443]|uniref:DoxX family protein n=1 Tax=Pontibacter TaxID=323449 RepID=UPI00164E0419|nr:MULTISPECIES: DoxX family membrane protein [Pontibacter]MBC5772438.1 DoxX family protein [Pontibacter sp. KCTC 32443]